VFLQFYREVVGQPARRRDRLIPTVAHIGEYSKDVVVALRVSATGVVTFALAAVAVSAPLLLARVLAVDDAAIAVGVVTRAVLMGNEMPETVLSSPLYLHMDVTTHA
jgi:hypothetical protein